MLVSALAVRGSCLLLEWAAPDERIITRHCGAEMTARSV
jgi:hypothetical protein